jgi:hypothetical protein
MLRSTCVGRAIGSDIPEMRPGALVLIKQGSGISVSAWFALYNVMAILTSGVYTCFPLECCGAIGYLGVRITFTRLGDKWTWTCIGGRCGRRAAHG